MRYLSLFSGIEAASVAWEPLGWTPVAFAEIEPFPCALLAHRFPSVPNLGDVTRITDAQIAALGPIDVVIGGSPCQDLSVAGKRAGLVGERSSLFHQQVRIFDAARHLCGARFLVWENVPGAFSTHGGRDFAVVVGTMAGCSVPVPADGWGSEGVALGEHGLVEWAVLDAQWFGVAQRRRRVFAVLDVGDWAGRPPVLLERESLRGDSAPRREAREGVAPSLAARARGGGGLGTDFNCDGGLIASNAEGSDGFTLTRSNLNTGLNNQTPLVAHALRADGFNASEDGTGRGTPIVPVPFDETQITHPANRSNQQPGDPSPTLRSIAEAGDNANGDGQVAVAFDARQSDVIQYGDKSGPLDTDANSIGVLAPAMQVRRLTPTECERLQGFPDDWTAIPHRGKPAADGPRYRALGNSMAVPVIRWIGRQIERAAA